MSQTATPTTPPPATRACAGSATSAAEPGYAYIGDELELFAHAVNWKSYLRGALSRYVQGDVLEVGAGLGGTTRLLRPLGGPSWVCLEPDPSLANQLETNLAAAERLAPCEVKVGTIADLPDTRRFDSILYIDVLEHIEDDEGELRRAAARLKPGGRICVLSPAHPWLYSPFDQAIGHYRRYSVGMIHQLHVKLPLERVKYLDSVGLLASSANRLFLKASMPTLAQIHTWDRYMIPLSRWLDPLTFGSLGKSILAVWRKV